MIGGASDSAVEGREELELWTDRAVEGREVLELWTDRAVEGREENDPSISLLL